MIRKENYKLIIKKIKKERAMRSGVRVACFYMHARRVGIVNLDAEEHQNRAATLCTRVYLHA